MTEKPLVSVIINCYNSEKYLRETIDSLIAQTYENWEAIFWDNCSVDKTAEIIASYNEPRFRYFLAKKNTPLGEARNLAMENVQGEYLCFLDSDDVWLPDFLNEGMSFFYKYTNIVAFYSNYYVWKSDQKSLYHKKRSSGIHSIKYLIKEYGIGMSACIMNSSIILGNGILFNKNYQLIEDLDFFIKIAEIGNFYYDKTPLCLYRVHDSNTTITLKKQWANEYKDFYNILLNKYVNSECQILNVGDIDRIKKCMVSWMIEDCIEDNDRSHLICIIRENKDVLFNKLNLIFFLIFGKKLYLLIKNKIRR